jgi:hypothetical protein
MRGMALRLLQDPAGRQERLQDLRELILRKGGVAREEAAGAVPTGWEALDAALSQGGFPRGGVTEVLGGPGSGKCSLVARCMVEAVRRNQRVAFVSARGPLYAPALARAGLPPGGLLQVCPLEATRVAWAAEQLVRSGVFTLVALDAPPSLTEVDFRRLLGACRGTGSALVVLLEPDPSLAGIPRTPALRLGVRRLPPRASAPRGTPTARTTGMCPSTMPTLPCTQVTVLACRGAPAGAMVRLQTGNA